MIDLQTVAYLRNYVNEKVSEIQEKTQGESAYEVAVRNGFVGTEKEWLESLKGNASDLSEYIRRDQLIALTNEEIHELCK